MVTLEERVSWLEGAFQQLMARVDVLPTRDEVRAEVRAEIRASEVPDDQVDGRHDGGSGRADNGGGRRRRRAGEADFVTYRLMRLFR